MCDTDRVLACGPSHHTAEAASITLARARQCIAIRSVSVGSACPAPSASQPTRECEIQRGVANCDGRARLMAEFACLAESSAHRPQRAGRPDGVIHRQQYVRLQQSWLSPLPARWISSRSVVLRLLLGLPPTHHELLRPQNSATWCRTARTGTRHETREGGRHPRPHPLRYPQRAKVGRPVGERAGGMRGRPTQAGRLSRQTSARPSHRDATPSAHSLS
jgi:hypothetical protein